MHAFPSLASLALLLASRIAFVHASVYFTSPIQSTTCTGGQSCLVQWVDNGETPLLADIGECEVGLYTGELTLAQSLPSVDVSTTSSFSFTPSPAAGPNGQYYIVFTASGINYQAFSGSFTLTGMSGTTPGGGTSTPGTSPTDTTTGSSVSASLVTTAATGTPSPTVTTPPPTGTPSSVVPTSPTTTASKTSTSTSASASASATNAAAHIGSSTSLGGVAALLVLSGVLVF